MTSISFSIQTSLLLIKIALTISVVLGIAASTTAAAAVDNVASGTQSIGGVTTTSDLRDGEGSVHFNFKTENGYTRTEDIKFNNTLNMDNSKSSSINNNNNSNENSDKNAENKGIGKDNNNNVKAVEYRGGYSFISADGYEYTVLYKANKKGFYPYVTARKLKPDENLTKN